MVHVFKRVSISDEEAEIRFFRVYGTPPTHLKVKFFGGGKQLFANIHAVYALVNKNWTRN